MSESINSGSSFYVTAGTLRADAPSYVERQADRELLDQLLLGEFCYILTSRQMGKSSLMVRVAQRLREMGVHLAVLDLAGLGQNLTPEQWYDSLLLRIGRQIYLEDELEDYWVNHGRVAPCERFFNSLSEIALPKLAARSPATPSPGQATKAAPGSLVIFVDELDVVRSLPFPADEFFVAIRGNYNGRTEDPNLKRLTFCLLGVATPSELIKDPYTTPFNIGRRIQLSDFTPKEARGLASGLKHSRLNPGGSESLLDRVMYWTHGHPYLTQKMFQELCLHPDDCLARSELECVDALNNTLFLSPRARESDDNLLFVRERILRTEMDLSTVLDLYEKVLNGQPVKDNESDPAINQLRLAGIVRVEADGTLAVRNRIYQQVFDNAWVTSVKPIAELETHEGKRCRIRTNFAIGRISSNDLLLENVKVSRLHALIRKQGSNDLLLVDLGSRNGTLLNGERVTRAMLLRDKDRIEIGPYRLIFHQPNAPRIGNEDQSTQDKTIVDF